ncbi:hypothetical protein FN846DRAFT_1021864 [Sphaerosporella brunnea]|uniref:Uncharacterized protein n=1 Tax=Sphaerosporella brunnea TaxID=1250544 RepID=A0A5J5EV81_9PEZI|nr:hypothetical protein FN846DRAFT_1021864 [Sphaerosporella brunnea]
MKFFIAACVLLSLVLSAIGVFAENISHVDDTASTRSHISADTTPTRSHFSADTTPTRSIISLIADTASTRSVTASTRSATAPPFGHSEHSPGRISQLLSRLRELERSLTRYPGFTSIGDELFGLHSTAANDHSEERDYLMTQTFLTGRTLSSMLHDASEIHHLRSELESITGTGHATATVHANTATATMQLTAMSSGSGNHTGHTTSVASASTVDKHIMTTTQGAASTSGADSTSGAFHAGGVMGSVLVLLLVIVVV